MKEYNKEENVIRAFISNYSRNPNQINGWNQSDSEIINLNEYIKKSNHLAITCDTISEELAIGLYDEYLAGYMSVTASLSDLAAVGAAPIGLLSSICLPESLSIAKTDEISKGIDDACKKHNTYILGGDTNFLDRIVISSTAIGICEYPISRIGAKENDIIYSSSLLGSGNLFALTKLLDWQSTNYHPNAKLNEGKIISKYANSCIDTSDGTFSSLRILMNCNNIGIALNSVESIIYKDTYHTCKSLQIPSWTMLAGNHGEYELIFTISKENEQEMLKELSKINSYPVEIGRVNGSGKLSICNSDLVFSSNDLIFPDIRTSNDLRNYIKNFARVI